MHIYLRSVNIVQSENPENTNKTVKEDKQAINYTFLIYAVCNTSLIIVIAIISLSISLFYIIPIIVALFLCYLVLYGVITNRTGVFYVKYGALVLVLLGMLALLIMLDRWHLAVILVLGFLDVGFLIRFFFYYAFNHARLSKLIPGSRFFGHKYQSNKDE